MSEHILKRHNKSLLQYHIVFPVKYRRKALTEAVEATLKETCLGMGARYEIGFLEIGMDKDHVHFLVQSVPTMPPGRLVQIIKSITAREIYRTNPEVRKILWGGYFWTTGYYINTVGAYANEELIRTCVESQGKQCQKILLHNSHFWMTCCDALIPRSLLRGSSFCTGFFYRYSNVRFSLIPLLL